MIKIKLWILGLLAIPLLLFVPSVSAADLLPPPSGYINDFAGVLNQEQKQDLESDLSNYDKSSGNQIAVALVKDLGGDDINDFASRVFEEWKIGEKDKDNGVLFIASINDRQMRIEVGYGLEPYLTDSQAGSIIRDDIAPEFKKGDYYTGVDKGISEIKEYIGGGSAEGVSTKTDSLKPFLNPAVFVLFFIIVQLIIYLGAFLARSEEYWLGGLIGVVIGILFGIAVSYVLAGVISAIIFGIAGLLVDHHLSRTYKHLKSQGKDTSWWGSGGGFFFGGGGSGGGGFGGFGGGGSGGGGASGGW